MILRRLAGTVAEGALSTRQSRLTVGMSFTGTRYPSRVRTSQRVASRARVSPARGRSLGMLTDMSCLLVSLSHGGSYAPCMSVYRIKSETEHRRAMAHVAANGGPTPEDEYGRDDNVLLSDDAAEEIIASANRRKLAEFREGYDVTLRLDRWEAFAHYGYDAGDTLG